MRDELIKHEKQTHSDWGLICNRLLSKGFAKRNKNLDYERRLGLLQRKPQISVERSQRHMIDHIADLLNFSVVPWRSVLSQSPSRRQRVYVRRPSDDLFDIPLEKLR